MNMAIRGLLTSEEKSLMEKYIDANAASNGGCRRTVDIDYILREWAAAKSEHLIKMMNGQLIVSEYIEYKKGQDQLSAEIYDKMCRSYSSESDKASCEFWHEFHAKVVNHYRDTEDREIGWALDNLMHHCTLAKNVYEGLSYDLPLPSGRTFKLATGCRATRAIGKLAEAFGVEGFEHFRIVHSQILNQKSLKGELCISIHPMDYMTMSDNDCDWESCMSWTNHGCYRQGTVEMMNSPMVIVAYLKAKDDWRPVWGSETLWNSKKWRELYIVTPEVITNVKSYPYHNEGLTSIVLKKLKSMMETAGLAHFCDNIITYDIGSSFDHPFKEGEKIKLDASTDYMYNDFGDDQMCFISETCDTGWVNLHYSGKSECMTCGDLRIWLEDGDEGSLCCDSCEPSRRCDKCGDRICDDDYYYVDGECICSYCYDECTFDDMETGEIHLRDYLVEITVADVANRKIFPNYTIMVDENTFGSEEFHKKWFGGENKVIENIEIRWHRYRVVDVSALTDYALEMMEFDFDGEAERAEIETEIRASYSVAFEYNF